jgi:hypothetical protein
MLSPFQSALADVFYQLHPLLQQHYGLALGESIVFTGQMDAWNKLQMVQPLMPFTPKPGKDLPVTLKNDLQLDPNDNVQFVWQRTFTYPSGIFNNQTSTVVSSHTTGCVVDVFRAGATIGIELALNVANNGYALIQRSTSHQWLMFGNRSIALPRLMCLNVEATERVVDDHIIETHVEVGHRFSRAIFGYGGRLRRVG